MKIVLLSLLAAVALSQPGGNQNVIDDIHGFRVEYDDRNDIVIFVSNDECYIIEAADATWDSIVRDQEQLHVVVDEIYAQFTAGTGVVSLTQQEAAQAYDSSLEQGQCREKDIFRVRYTPDV
ncbi:hypothetical protein MP969_25790 [Escherichia coli]|nr:hypothetical protein [Escherichia coli]